MGSKKAFTLIELLVVIAIIAILAAVLFPVFARAREAAKQSVCATHMGQTGIAFLLYNEDNDSRVHTLYYQDSRRESKPPNLGFWRWPWLTRTYARSFDVYLCPSDTNNDDYCSDGKNPGCRDPKNDYYGYLFGLLPSWGYNAHYLSPGLDPDAPDDYPYAPISVKKIRHPAETVVYAESTWNTGGRAQIGFYRVYPPSQWAGSPPMNGFSFGHVWPRHGHDRATVFFADGHVKTLSIGALNDETLWDLR